MLNKDKPRITSQNKKKIGAVPSAPSWAQTEKTKCLGLTQKKKKKKKKK